MTTIFLQYEVCVKKWLIPVTHLSIIRRLSNNPKLRRFMTRLAILLRSALLILTLVCVSQTMARSQKYKVTIKAKEQRLLDVFKTIQKQTNLIVFYSNTILNDQEKVSIQVKDEALEKVLDQIVAGKALQYEVQEKYIVISPKEIKKQTTKEEGVVSAEDVPAPPPTIDVSGRITDEDGNPLMGASVMIKGTKLGTQTNADGYFILKGVDEKAVLEIGYVGFEKRELLATSMRAVRTLTLKRKDSPLDEVQLIAYGQTSKRLATGNTTTVKADEIERQPVQNPLLALQGRVPGLVVTQTTGMANGHVQIRIQGQNNINDERSEPLIVIDGVPYPTSLVADGTGAPTGNPIKGASPLSFINPLDIESIDVLKDADATSIYGSMGANGVILITTKKGKPGRVGVNIRMQQGWGKVTRKLHLMDTRQYLDMRYEAIRNDGLTITSATNNDLRLWDTTRYTDWQKTLIGETAQNLNFSVGISGGTAAAQYMISGTYSRVTDVFPGDFANSSGSLHMSLGSSSSNRRFKTQFSASYFVNENLLPAEDLTRFINMAPVAPALYNDDGSLNWATNASGTKTWDNPLSHLAYRNVENNAQNLISNLTLSYIVFPGLNIKTALAYNKLSNSALRGTPLEFYSPEERPNASRSVFLNRASRENWIVEPQITYQAKFANLLVDALVGSALQKRGQESLTLQANNFSSDLLMSALGNGTPQQSLSSENVYRYAALFGRVGLNLSNKYVLNFNVRRDGSSRFGDANKYHTFASIGGAWIWTNEKRLQEFLPFLTHGKLRTSYGVTGSDNIGDYQYRSAYGALPANVPYQGINSVTTSAVPNPSLQWEEVRKLSIGLELGFLSDRIFAGIDYNRNRSSNQLDKWQLPSLTGFTGITMNMPILIQNTSWEFMFRGTPVKSKTLSWQSSINFTIPQNKLLAFEGIEKTSYANGGGSGVYIGRPLGTIRAYRFWGIDPATGSSLVYDAQGNPTSSPNGSLVNGDRTEFISTLPDFYGGFSNSISFKGLQLDFLFQFSRQLGTSDYYYFGQTSALGRFISSTASNQPISVLGRWQKPGDQTNFTPFTTTTSYYNNIVDSRQAYSYRASYIRLKNLALSWMIPDQWIKKAGLQSAKLSFQGQNLLTISGYTGLDPETPGMGSLRLPPLQMWTINMQLFF